MVLVGIIRNVFIIKVYCFRQTPAENYTQPKGKAGYQVPKSYFYFHVQVIDYMIKISILQSHVVPIDHNYLDFYHKHRNWVHCHAARWWKYGIDPITVFLNMERIHMRHGIWVEIALFEVRFCLIFVQKWWTKWHAEHPEWREEHYRADPRTPVMRWKEFQSGTMRPAYTASWEKPAWRQEYLRQVG